jgi:hypothetical protein
MIVSWFSAIMSITDPMKLLPLDLDDLQERAQQIIRKFTAAEDRPITVSLSEDENYSTSKVVTSSSLSSQEKDVSERNTSASQLPTKSIAGRPGLRDGIIWDNQSYGKEHACIFSVICDSSRDLYSIQTHNHDFDDLPAYHLKPSLSTRSPKGNDVILANGLQSPDRAGSKSIEQSPSAIRRTSHALGRSKSLKLRTGSSASKAQPDDLSDERQSSPLLGLSQQGVHPAFRVKPDDRVRIENRGGDMFLVHERNRSVPRRSNSRSSTCREQQPQLSLDTKAPAAEEKDTLSPILGCKIPGIDMFGPVLGAPEDGVSSAPHHHIPLRVEKTRRSERSDTPSPARRPSILFPTASTDALENSSHYTYGKPSKPSSNTMFESPRTAPQPAKLTLFDQDSRATPSLSPVQRRDSHQGTHYIASSPQCYEDSASEVEPSYTPPKSIRSPPPARRLRSSSSTGRYEALSTIIESRYEHSSAFQVPSGAESLQQRPALVNSYTLPLARAVSRPDGSGVVVEGPTGERGFGDRRRRSLLQGSSRRGGIVFDGGYESFL